MGLGERRGVSLPVLRACTGGLTPRRSPNHPSLRQTRLQKPRPEERSMHRRAAVALLLLVPCCAALLALAAREQPSPKSTPPSGDVRAHGAKGDGEADDAAAVQKAIDSGAGAIRFGKGTYRLTRTVAIPLDKV